MSILISCACVAGASYSGIYVPLLGEATINGNDDGASPYINLEVCMPAN